MQNLWRLIIAALLGLGSIQAAEVVRLVTWNLEWFPGKKPSATQSERDAHFLEVAAILPQFAADVIVLQEVRNWQAAEDLAKVLPGFSVHVTSAVNYRPPAPERWGGGFLFESGAGRFLAGVLRPLVPMGRCD